MFIAAAIAALVYAAWDLLLRGGTEQPSEEEPVIARASLGELTQLVKAMGDELQSARLSARDVYVIEGALREWPRCPFFDGKLPAEMALEEAKTEEERQQAQKAAKQRADEAKAKTSTRLAAETARRARMLEFRNMLSYTGYLELNGTRAAIINGVEYQVGDELTTGSCVVKQIERTEVTLVFKEGEEEIVVPNVSLEE